jgi:hypothetical protein
VAYGNTNKYSPVNRSNASGRSGEYVTHGGGVPWDRAMKLAITVSVNATDTQR